MHRLAALLAFEQAPQGAVEAQQVDDHPLEAHAGDVPRLAVDAARRAAVFEVDLLALDREAHVRRLARDAEAVEQARERRVVAVVHHDEGIVSRKRRFAGQHFIKDDAQRVDVASRIAALALHLFRRDVIRRTHYVR